MGGLGILINILMEFFFFNMMANGCSNSGETHAQFSQRTRNNVVPSIFSFFHMKEKQKKNTKETFIPEKYLSLKF